MKQGTDVHRNLFLFLAFFLFTLTTTIAGQTTLKIMPLGNSITFDTYSGDVRPDAEKYSYRYHLYSLLQTGGYTFDFVGSEKSGGALLPETPPDYTDNAGFPGYTASEILSMLQTGRNRNGDCEIASCDGSYLQYFDPDVILLHLGTNGLNTETDADNISAVMGNILDEINTYESSAGKSVPVFLARIINRAGPNQNGNHDVTSYYNNALASMATGRVGDNIIMVDMENGAGLDYRLSPTGDMLDELHPATSGYDKMGEKWYEALEAYNFSPASQPTDITLSPSAIDENQPSGTLVGTLTTTDPDVGDTHTYLLVSGAGSDDNASFSISGNQLLSSVVFDTETKSVYSVRIRTTDALLETYEEAFTITITNVNEQPTDITLSASVIAENQPANSVVGTLSVTDPDAGDTHSYALVIGPGSTDNASFNLSGNQLRINAPFDYETKSSYSIRIRATDFIGAAYEEAFTITVTNVNESPTDITLSNATIAENQPVNTVVGTLSTTDPDAGDTPTYSLVSGTGSTDNASFNLSGNQLQSSAIFDYETKSSYSIRIRTTDGITTPYEEIFTITITFANQAPTDISLAPSSIQENQPVNTVVGTFTTTDPNGSDVHTYSLVSGTGSTDNGSFSISGNQLLAGAAFDFETKSSYSIRVRTTDGGSLFFTKVFTITVTNVSEAPTDIALSNSTIAENQPANTAIGTLSSVDQDAGDSFIYTLVSGTGSTDNVSFNISGTQLRSSTMFDFETKSSYSVRIRSTDGNSLFFEEAFTITVTNVNEAPTLGNIESSNLNYAEGAGEVAVSSTITVTDLDNASLSSAVAQISTGFNALQDRLRYATQDGIIGSFNTTTGVLNLSGIATVAQYQAALRRVRYENINTTNPSTVTRVVSFTVNDGEFSSNQVSRNIAINSSNSAPVLDNIEDQSIIYCVKSGAVIVTSTITVADQDNDTLKSAVVRIASGLVTAEDRLNFTSQNGITGSYVAATGTLNLTGLTTKANYQTALRSIRYENTNLINPVASTRTVSFTVNDGTDNSNTVSRSVIVNGVVKGIFSGSQTICDDGYSTAPLSLNLSGKSPWTFTVRRNVSNDTTYTGVTADPYIINGRVIGTSPTTYRIVAISDANCEGDTASGTVRISYISPNNPRAEISGVDTICTGETAVLRVTLTGTSPWSITYLRNGANPTVVNGITSANYNLQVTSAGTYTLSRVSDATCTGKVSGSGIVRLYSAPTATLSGSSTPICEHTSTTLSVALTGNSPWKFSYKIGNDTVDILNVLATPKNISVKKGGTYTLVEVYDKNCKGTVSGSVTVNILPAPDVTLTGLEPAYNTSTNWIPVYGTPDGGIFSGPALFEVRDTMFFFPSIAGVGTHTIVYSYRSPVNLCYGYDTSIVRVLTANADIVFPNNKTFYCYNDAPFTVTGLNTANNTGSFTISSGHGLVDNHNNTATIYPPQLTPGVYEITYTYYDGAVLQVKENFTIGEKPVADFTWETECFHAGVPISFKDKSDPNEGTISAYKWLFHNPTGYDSIVTKDATYAFSTPGNYQVDLQIRTSYGCSDSLVRIFGLRPTVILAEDIYDENFDDRPVSWRSTNLSTIPVNSWMLGDPVKGYSGPASGDNCWYTYISSTNAPREQSWVTSPCFDFTDTQKPMLKMKIWRLFNVVRDGAVLQASADSGKSWQNVGQLLDGLNWFNEYSILGNPGGQPIGWANARDAEWIESRHSLDVFNNKKDIQFRIAYGSDGTARNTDGIAFDNVWIGERNRTALVEHFTNASDAASVTANQQLNEIVNADSLSIIDLQYHTSFPGNDIFNDEEPYAPSTRVLYYGLTKVPYTLLNGGSKSAHRFDYDINELDANLLHIESLSDSKFWININSQLSSAALNVEVEVTALQAIPVSELTIHVAIIERKITDVTGGNGETIFESVVKKLLPDAAGTTLYKSWVENEPYSVAAEWNLENVHDRKELRIVAFIQDESTREVYQAALDTIGTMTGIEDYFPGNAAEKAFVIYPNPAARLTYVKFNDPLREDIKLELYNNLGSLVYKMEIPEGTDETQIPVEDFPDGVYLIRMISNEGIVGTGKLTVTK